MTSTTTLEPAKLADREALARIKHVFSSYIIEVAFVADRCSRFAFGTDCACGWHKVSGTIADAGYAIEMHWRTRNVVAAPPRLCDFSESTRFGTEECDSPAETGSDFCALHDSVMREYASVDYGCDDDYNPWDAS